MPGIWDCCGVILPVSLEKVYYPEKGILTEVLLQSTASVSLANGSDYFDWNPGMLKLEAAL